MMSLAKLLYHLHKEMETHGNAEVLSIGSGAGYGKDVYFITLKRDEGAVRIAIDDDPLPDNDFQASRHKKKPVPGRSERQFADLKEGEKAVFVITGGDFPPETLHTYHHTLRAFKEQETVILTTCLEFFSQKTLDKGYRLFAVSEKGIEEAVRGQENPAGRLLSSTVDLRKLLLAGEFTAAKEEA